MSTVHMILQGKGGVGKSMVAAMLAQYKMSKKQTPLCIDTDPVNSTLSGYKALNVEKVDILENKKINPRQFDFVVDKISQTTDDVIVDNGASSFVALAQYLIANDIPALLGEINRSIVIHTVITGGQAQDDTLNGFNYLVKEFPSECTFVPWLNNYWGLIERDGMHFSEMRVCMENQHRISGIVDIPRLDEDTFGRDFSDMLKARLTFDEAIKNPSLTIVSRSRLHKIRERIFDALDLFEEFL